jgi:hypothetical protein
MSGGMTNTYQLGPAPNEQFVPSKIDNIVKSAVDSNLTSFTDANQFSQFLSEKVRDAVMAEGGIPRHRIIAHTVVAERGGQPLLVASKSLWDNTTDNYSSYRTKSLCGKFEICATVFCVYKE